MMTVLILLILIACFYGFYKFTQLENRFDILEEQIKTLKKELLRYAAEKKSVYESPLPFQTESAVPHKSEEPFVSNISAPAMADKVKNKPEPVSSSQIYLPVILPPGPELPPSSPIPPPSAIEPSATPTPKLETTSSTLFEEQIASAAPGSISKANKPEESKSRPAYEPYKPSALEEKWEDFKNNVDWEQFTGVKLFAWLGGFALFVGAIFFVKYSIDNNLIPPQLRLAIGALVGLGMLASSLFINRDRYNTTAHTLAAGGIAVLYAVSFTATVYYDFIPKIIGFCLFALISAAAFVLAVYHQGRFISVLGAIGAYATPLLIQTGHPNLVGLFIYLTVVNLGLFEVIRRTGWFPLSMLVTVCTLLTLSAGAWGTHPPAKSYLIALITMANLIVFSLFFWIYRGENAANRSILLSIRTLFTSTILAAFLLFGAEPDFNYLPLLLITVATCVAMILAYAEKTWGIGFIYYTLAGFFIIAIWSYMKFDLSKPSPEMLIFFIYGSIAGLGPIFVIRKHGVEADSLTWLKIFPAALAALAVIIFFKSDSTSFFFWPMLMGIGVIGILIGMLIGSLLSAGALIFLLLIGGIGWIFKTPILQIGIEFFIFILIAGLLICFLTALFFKKAGQWRFVSSDQSSEDSFSPGSLIASQWVTALPVLGPFILLSLVLMRQYPLSPNPAMAAGLCFFAIAIFLARYFAAQEILTVTLAAMTFTLLSWGLKFNSGIQVYYLLLYWCSFFWTVALTLPNILCRPENNWKIGWYAWAFFELVMACLIVYAIDYIWKREVAGWIPLALAILKLPVVFMLLKRLEGDESRNSILAFHGGVLLFYVSSISVLLLGNSWIGVSFVTEAMLLLWLNRRIEHSGLRWVSMCLAPIGFALLLTDIGSLKSLNDMPVLNLAVFSCTICVIALSISVKFAGYPQKELAANFSLPDYFLWLACGTGFFLLNLIVTDIFGGVGGGFKLEFYQNINQYISHTLLWVIFAALLLRIRLVPSGLKFAGLMILMSGLIAVLCAPFYFSRHIATMTPLLNPLLILFVPVLAALICLVLAQTEDDWGEISLKNLFIALFIIVGLLALTSEISTVFNQMVPFNLLQGHSSSMSLALILTWFLFGLGLLLWPRLLNDYFRLTGALLVLISLARAVYYPLLYAQTFGAVTPLLNIPTLIFLILIAGLAVLIIKNYDQVWTFNESVFSSRYLWGPCLILFSFYVTNVQVASVFGMFNTGAEAGQFTFYTHGRLSQQLAYSISWLIFAIILLSIGIRWKLIQIRWVALSLLVMTALKVFFKDLWALGQLYRVFSLIGLAVTSIFVSFIYQRYLGSGKKAKEDLREEN